MEGYGCGYDEVHVWTPEKCSYEVLVHADGKVSSNLTSRTADVNMPVTPTESHDCALNNGQIIVTHL